MVTLINSYRTMVELQDVLQDASICMGYRGGAVRGIKFGKWEGLFFFYSVSYLASAILVACNRRKLAVVDTTLLHHFCINK